MSTKCAVDKQKVINASRNPDITFRFDDTSTFRDVVAALDKIQNTFELVIQPSAKPYTSEDDLQRYTYKLDPKYYLSKRVTSELQKKYHRDRTGKQRKNFTDKNKIRMEGGTYVHQMAEDIGKEYYQMKIDPDYKPVDLRAKALAGEDGFKLSNEQFDGLQKQVKKIIDDAFAMQDQINKRNGTSGNPEIRFEQILVDPIKDVAGTMDIVVVFNDKSAMIYDYKTMSVASAYRVGDTIMKEGFIYASKKNNWKLQQSEYKRILFERYGIKQVLGTRIVPMWIDFGFNKKTNSITKEITTLQTGAQSEFLKEVMATYEKTGIKDIDLFLTNRYKRLERLKERSKREYKNRDVIQARIERIEKSIYEFLIDEDIKGLIRDSNLAMNKVLKKLEKDPESVTFAEINDAFDDGKTLIDFLDNVAITYDVGVNQETELIKHVSEVLKNNVVQIDAAKRAFGHIAAAQREMTLDPIRLKQGEIEKPSGEIEIHEEGFFTQVWGRLSEFHNPFLERFRDLLDLSQDNMRESVREVGDRIADKENAVYTWLKSRGEGHNDLKKHLVNPKTGNMHARISKEFYDRLQEAKENDNFTFITNRYKIRDGYEQWFAEKLKEIREDAERLYANDETADKERRIQEYVDRFVISNDLTLKKDGSPLRREAWRKAGRSYWLQLKDSVFDEYMNEGYKFINQHKPLREYYEMISELNDEFRDMLGVDYGTIPSNFLPNIKADMVERLARGDYKGSTDNIWEMFGTVQEDETMFGQKSKIEGEKQIPIFFTNPFTNPDGTVNTDAKSFDFGRSMLIFAKMAYTHKYMAEIEAETLAIRDVMNMNVKYLKKDERGQKVYDFMANLATKKHKGESTTERTFNAMIDFYIYGKRIDEDGRNFKMFGREFNSTKFLLGMKNYMSLKTLGLGFIPGTASYVAARTQAWIEGQKGVIYNKDQWWQATKYMASSTTNKKYHAMGYFFGAYGGDITEYISTRGNDGTGKNVTGMLSGEEASRGVQRYVNTRLLMRPYSYGDERIDRHITVAMAQNYGVDSDGNVKRLQNLEGEDKVPLWERFEYDHTTGKSTIKGFDEAGTQKVRINFRKAVREAQQTVKGTMSQEDINYAQTNLMLNLVMQFKSWMPGIIKERFGDLRYNKILDAPQYGRYRAVWDEASDIEDAFSIAYMMKLAGNSLAIVGRDMTRIFGSNGYQVDRKKAKIAFELYKEANPHLVKGMSLDDFIEVKQRAIRGAMTELGLMVLLGAILYAMAADWDDDGKPLYKDNWVFHTTYKILNRTYTEIASFVPFNPMAVTELQKLTRNPIPVSGVLLDAGKLMGNSFDEMIDIITKRDDAYDRTAPGYYGWGFFPGGLQLRRFLRLYEQDMNATR